jgi:hypothetical protein
MPPGSKAARKGGLFSFRHRSPHCFGNKRSNRNDVQLRPVRLRDHDRVGEGDGPDPTLRVRAAVRPRARDQRQWRDAEMRLRRPFGINCQWKLGVKANEYCPLDQTLITGQGVSRTME